MEEGFKSPEEQQAAEEFERSQEGQRAQELRGEIIRVLNDPASQAVIEKQKRIAGSDEQKVASADLDDIKRRIQWYPKGEFQGSVAQIIEGFHHARTNQGKENLVNIQVAGIRLPTEFTSGKTANLLGKLEVEIDPTDRPDQQLSETTDVGLAHRVHFLPNALLSISESGGIADPEYQGLSDDEKRELEGNLTGYGKTISEKGNLDFDREIEGICQRLIADLKQ